MFEKKYKENQYTVNSYEMFALNLMRLDSEFLLCLQSLQVIYEVQLKLRQNLPLISSKRLSQELSCSDQP